MRHPLRAMISTRSTDRRYTSADRARASPLEAIGWYNQQFTLLTRLEERSPFALRGC
jgi:hypothetical protein